MRRIVLFFIVLAFGCGTPSVHEYLDDDTAATITVATRGSVFARERTDLAVNARDYITVTPVLVNRGGQRTIYLYCQLWSTIDRRGDKAIVPANAVLALIADDRRIALPRPSDLRRMGFGGMPVKSPSASTEIRIAETDRDVLHFITAANEVRVAMAIEGRTEYFLLWRDRRAAMIDFLRQVDRSMQLRTSSM